jgi:hypothetical protein
MTTKQIKMAFQVENSAGETNTVQVQLNGVIKFNGTLPETGPLIIGGDSYSVTTIEFDQDVADWASGNTTPVNTPLTVSVTGGSVALQTTESNYNIIFTNTGTEEAPVWVASAGNAETYQTCNIVEQPTWAGEALLDRYNIEYNNGPIQVTGPGQLEVYSGETVETVLAIARFNNSIETGEAEAPL